MPELMVLRCERPQPKPRLSLLLLKPPENCTIDQLTCDYSESSTRKDVPKLGPRARKHAITNLPGESAVCLRITQDKNSDEVHSRPAACGLWRRKHVCINPRKKKLYFKRTDSKNSADSFQPIRCKPYNSPRLRKSRRSQNSVMQSVKTDGKGSSIPRGTTSSRQGRLSANAEQKRCPSVTSRNLPSRSERGAVSTFSQLRKPTFKKLEEASKDSDSASSGSTGSLNSDIRRRASSTGSNAGDRRKSAAVPPQMVANLANKFNALISENHKPPPSLLLDGGTRKFAKGNSSLPTFQSCPSSPLRNAITKQTKISKFTATSIRPTNESAKRKEAGNEFKSKRQTSDSGSSSPKSSPKSSPRHSPKLSSPVSIRKKSFVQQAVLNYEVTLSTSTSPAEIRRSNSLPKRSVASSEESRLDAFASPILLRRRLQSDAEARASKFTAESNHESNHCIEIRRQEMPKPCASRFSSNVGSSSREATHYSTLSKKTEEILNRIESRQKVPAMVQVANGHSNDVQSGNSDKELKTTGSYLHDSDKIGAGNYRQCGVATLIKERELLDKKVTKCENRVKGLPPPLPATQPRQIMKRNNSVHGKLQDRSGNKLVQLADYSQSSFLHSRISIDGADKVIKSGIELSKIGEDKKLHSTLITESEVTYKSSFLHSANSEVRDVKLETEAKKLLTEKSNYVPNTSFLWRKMKTTATGCAIPPPPSTAPPPIPESIAEQVELNNIYDDVASPGSEELYDEPFYSEANVTPIRDGYEKSDFITNNDSDEGWVDVSDTETEGTNGNTASLTVNSRLKAGTKKSPLKRYSPVRRASWYLGEKKQDVPMTSAPEEFADFDDDFSDSDESNSTNPDHHYEALYELNQQRLKNDAARLSAVESRNSEDCILEESPEDNENKDLVSRCSLTIDPNAVAVKKEKRLKRNWSLTKSDIRLELTSRLNKIRIKKTSTSASDVHSVENEAKKTKAWSIRTPFTRKGPEPVSPTKKSPSPKKESALFYIPNCVSPISSESSDSVSGCKKTVNFKGLRRLSGSNVVRPKEPPPAPPIQASSKSSVGSVSSIESRPPTAVSSDWELVQENDNYSRFSGSEVNSVKNLDSDSDSLNSGIRYCDLETRLKRRVDVSRSNSTVSSESEITVFLHASSKSSTIGSSKSNSSNENYSQNEDTEPSLFEQMSQLYQEAAQQNLGGLGSASSDSATNLSSDSEDRSGYFLRAHTSHGAKMSPFDDEPLYQFYNINAQKRATQMNFMDDSDEEIYEAIPKNDEKNPVLTSQLSAMDLLVPNETGQRSLWGELSEVRKSGLLETITPQERGLQEAMFEVVTSEASYMKSLNVLVNHFMSCRQFTDEYSTNCVLSKRERHILFSDVLPVKKVSERLLADLEKRWQENIMMTEICDILLDHANMYFNVFIKYCSNQVYQDRTLKELKEKSPLFVEVLKRLESSPKCQSLDMHSFLMLPMQRITRLPLLVDAIFHRLKEGTKEYETCQVLLKKLNTIVKECNEGARKMARMEEMVLISKSLVFRTIKACPLVSASRWLVKRGDVHKLIFHEPSSKLGFGRRTPKQPIHMVLFTDHLLIAKKKADDTYHVLDHCPRNMVQVFEVEADQLPAKMPDGCKNLFKLTMLQNCEKKTVEMILSCTSESDRARWIEAVTPKISENPDEKIYESWDCPQVQVIHPYTAQQPDEFTLEESDVINVFKKVADGWHYGERIRDGSQGWFPANYTIEIVSAHVRARNLRQRYRLLQGLEEQRQKENL